MRWPGLDRRALARCHHDPKRIANLVASRTTLAPDAIVALLVGPRLTRDEVMILFG